MEKPKISIVTPSFNQGIFIEDAIISVMNQCKEPFEHLIIDNCSTDETAEVVSRYPHVTFISEPDEGQSDAINKGFLLAKGEIIGWLNADDFYMPDTFNKVLKVMEDPEVDAVYSNVKFINKDGEFKRKFHSHKAVKWLSLFHCYIPSTTFFFRKSIIEAGVLIDKDMHISMDKDFFANLMYKGYNFQYINDCFASFRWHDSNKSLETTETRKVRRKEGLVILNRYSNFSFNVSPFNVNMYGKIEDSLLLFRKVIRLQNYKYKISD